MTHALDHPYTTMPMMGPALIVEGDVGPHGGIEISLFYLRNPFSIKQGGRVIAESVKRLYLSTGYRYWFTDKFSLAAAFFSTYTIGDPKVMRNDFGTDLAPQTSARDTTEYGADLSVQYEPFRKNRWAMVIDGRYAYSVTPKKREDSNHYGVLLALKYFVQSRQESRSEMEEDY
jgi:hypothetical protein